MNETLEMPDRIAGGLRGLMAAMERMQARQQAALEPLAACATNIQQRVQQLGHVEAFARLGKAAGEVAALIQADGGEHTSVLEDVEAKLARITEEASSLFEAARSEDFPDVAGEVDALKQRVSALRGRLKRNGLSWREMRSRARRSDDFPELLRLDRARDRRVAVEANVRASL